MTAAVERAGGAREKIDPARLKAIIVGSLGNLVEYYDF